MWGLIIHYQVDFNSYYSYWCSSDATMPTQRNVNAMWMRPELRHKTSKYSRWMAEYSILGLLCFLIVKFPSVLLRTVNIISKLNFIKIVIFDGLHVICCCCVKRLVGFLHAINFHNVADKELYDRNFANSFVGPCTFFVWEGRAIKSIVLWMANN